MKTSKIFILIFLMAMSMAFASGCSSQANSSSNAQGQVVTVTRGNLETDITPSGNLIMPHQAKLTFGSAGTVEQVSVQIGDMVEKGQELAKLDTVSLQANLIQAQINVKSAQLNLERAETPTTNSSGTTVISAPDPLDIEIKQFQLDQAKLQVQDAQKQLDNATMVAPFDGWIAEVDVSVGDIVSNNTVAIRIIDPTQLEVDVLINEMDINQVKVGSPATVQITSIPGMNLTATAVAISPTATVQGGVVNYLVKVDVQPPKTSGGTFSSRGQTASVTADAQKSSISTPVIREGMSTTVSIITAQRKDALMLPNRAIISQGRDTIVQLVNEEGQLEQRTIQTGISNWQYVEVVSGLNEGDKVMVPQTSATSSQNSSSSTSQQQNRMLRPGGILR
jgi:RND family efflux transporter MFP subunit